MSICAEIHRKSVGVKSLFLDDWCSEDWHRNLKKLRQMNWSQAVAVGQWSGITRKTKSLPVNIFSLDRKPFNGWALYHAQAVKIWHLYPETKSASRRPLRYIWRKKFLQSPLFRQGDIFALDKNRPYRGSAFICLSFDAENQQHQKSALTNHLL